MAKMIPDTPRDFSPSSLEGAMFDGLSRLPDSYYVFHSFKIVSTQDGIVRESETDFVVFHPEKGLLCVEAKAGHVSYSDGLWYYGSGIEMRHGGPFEQARANMRKLMGLFEEKGLREELRNCKFLHAVWFPSVSKSEMRHVNLPSDADESIVMLKEDLLDPGEKIDRIFSLDVPSGTKTGLTAMQARRVVNRVLSPSFHLFVSSTLEIDLGKNAFRRMTEEQARIIDFLESQPSAAINGAAGTGKTVLAIEKAQRSALEKQKVLFLCFNRMLRDHLEDTHRNKYIDFRTIDGLAASLVKSDSCDPAALDERLWELCFDGAFPYQHIVVDEGQDFGQERYEEAGILETLSEIVLSRDDGTFYVFYDRMQLVQGANLPRCIENADCRITLHKNCRNTENIAITSQKPLHMKKTPLMRDGMMEGDLPTLHLIDTQADCYKAVLNAYRDCVDDGLSEIVVLTCGTLDKSALIGNVKDGRIELDGKKVLMTTCRRFKGLESDAVILVDVTERALAGTDVLLFYVGASRARFKLFIIGQLTEEECISVSKELGKASARRPRKSLATALNALLEA